MADSDITARGLLMLRLIPTFFTVVLVTLDTLDTHLGYYGHGLGYVYGKRSADAEPEAKADPYYLGYGYHGLGYAGHLGYAGLGHLGYGYVYGK